MNTCAPAHCLPHLWFSSRSSWFGLSRARSRFSCGSPETAACLILVSHRNDLPVTTVLPPPPAFTTPPPLTLPRCFHYCSAPPRNTVVSNLFLHIYATTAILPYRSARFIGSSDSRFVTGSHCYTVLLPQLFLLPPIISFQFRPYNCCVLLMPLRYLNAMGHTYYVSLPPGSATCYHYSPPYLHYIPLYNRTRLILPTVLQRKDILVSSRVIVLI